MISSPVRHPEDQRLHAAFQHDVRSGRAGEPVSPLPGPPFAFVWPDHADEV
jgi:hypothetical protein